MVSYYQHGPRPKPDTHPWPPEMKDNLWDKSYKVPRQDLAFQNLPDINKRWLGAQGSNVFVEPATKTQCAEIEDRHLTGHTTWMETLSARATHFSALAAKLTHCAWERSEQLAKEGKTPDDRLLRELHFEAHMLSEEAMVLTSQLFTHVHMARRKRVAEASGLPREDQARLTRLPIGDDDVFGPQAKNVEEWRKKPEVEQARNIVQLVHETQKASASTFKSPNASSSSSSSSSHKRSSYRGDSERSRHPASGRRAHTDYISPNRDRDIAASRRAQQNQGAYDRKPGAPPPKDKKSSYGKSSGSSDSSSRGNKRPRDFDRRDKDDKGDRGRSSSRGRGRKGRKP